MPDDETLGRLVTARLTAAGCVAADEEAAELMASAGDRVSLEAWIGRRERGEPLAWITGSLLFCDRRICVDPGVYVPRAQTEGLARRAAHRLGGDRLGGDRLGEGHKQVDEDRTVRAVDLCTGAGAVAAHLMAVRPGAVVVGVDDDARAVACARRNGVPAVRGDLDLPLRAGAFDLVTAVAPYVPTGELHLLPSDVQRYEPSQALDGGHDGLHLVRRVVASASRLLRPGGWLLLELGGDQDRLLAPTLGAWGFEPAEPWHDEDGDLRGIASRLGESYRQVGLGR